MGKHLKMLVRKKDGRLHVCKEGLGGFCLKQSQQNPLLHCSPGMLSFSIIHLILQRPARPDLGAPSPLVDIQGGLLQRSTCLVERTCHYCVNAHPSTEP